ncbi:MAG: substrate-binding domain-containing protein [Clostridia bacterium]|nr:substrate-binding domain-containing protein [Clostridia bacterium]
MENKLTLLTRQITADLKAGKFGESGEFFLTNRQLSADYGISINSACKIMTELIRLRLIRLHGKRYYITTGYASRHTPYGKLLAENRRKLLGMIVNKIDHPFFAALTKELCKAAADNGYTLLVSSSSNRVLREAEIIDEFISLGVSGIFACPGIDQDLLNLYALCPLPVVSLGRDLGIPNCDAVLVNNYSAGSQVADHLRKIGCTDFAYVGIQKYLETDPRRSGYTDRLHEFGCDLPKENIFEVDYQHDNYMDMEAVSIKVSGLLKCMSGSEKLGIFCYNDLLAVATLQRIKQYSRTASKIYRIPEDVAIVGFDDLPIASIITPALTTVSYRYGSITGQALSVMLDYISNPGHRTGKYEIFSSLCIRETTMKVIKCDTKH